MENLFTYGTLMFEPVWQAAVGKTYRTKKGVVRGYAVYRVREDVYPAMIKAGDDDSVEGLIYFDVDEETLDTLDRFEGVFYDRKKINVSTDRSQGVSCHAYVIKPAHFDILDCDIWSAEWFEANGLKKFLDNYFGFKNI
jgi:gamma-glutamylcyclotransferase (GGCT)/AIG2-like uncharacterized protein YtfP